MKRPTPSPADSPPSPATAGTRGWRRLFAAARTRRGRRIIDRILGVTGETLVTLGVVIGLFVAWELWWTDIGANRAQADIVANLNWDATPSPTASGTPGPSPSITNPDIVYPINAPRFSKRTDAPPVLAEPAHATTFATMYVPRWGYDYVRPISQGTDKKGVLDPLGIGHYNGTAMPGGLGNFSVAAHRTTYGKPFSAIEEIQVGDAVVIRTEGVWYVYRVTATEIVRPSNVGVIAPVPDQPGVDANGRYLTMTTCHPKYSASRRYVVHAELAYWTLSSAGYPEELVPPPVQTSPSPSSPSPTVRTTAPGVL